MLKFVILFALLAAVLARPELDGDHEGSSGVSSRDGADSHSLGRFKREKGMCTNGGCYRNRCWAWCSVKHKGGEWCYTTKGVHNDHKTVPCKIDSECDVCWDCAEPCIKGQGN